MAIDLQAHGESSGNVVTFGNREKHDVVAAVQYARAQHPGQPITGLGRSLGGASALLASHLNIDALIVESVFPDIRSAVHNRVAMSLGPASIVPTETLLIQLQLRLGIAAENLRPIDRIANIGCPVMIISGAQDCRTTPSETRRLFDSAAQPRELWLVDGVGHEDIHKHSPAEYERKVIAFLDRYAADSTATFPNQRSSNTTAKFGRSR